MRTVDPIAHGRQRERILKCALKLFASRGYDSASLGQIAGMCRMQKASLYHYFRNKEEILRNLIPWHMNRVHAAMRKLSPGGTMERNLFAVGMDFVRGFNKAENRDFLRLLIRELGTRGYVRKVFNAMDSDAIRKAMEAVRSLLAGQGKTMSPREHARIMHQFLGALFRYVVETRLVKFELPHVFRDGEYVRSLARVFARGLRP